MDHDTGLVPPALRLEAAGVSRLGERRENNEDAFAALPHLGLFLVADGLFGHASGEVAAWMAVDLVHEVFEEGARGVASGLPRRPSLPLLVRAIQRANRRIFEAHQEDPLLRGMSTTFVGVHAHPEGVSVAHVGDSRCYRLRAGRLTRLTEDHTFASDLERLERLPGGPLRELGRMVSRSLGEGPSVQPDTRREETRPGDLLLLCTDGLTSGLDDPEIAAVLAEKGDVRELAAELVERAGEKDAANDTTVVLLRWPGGPGC